MWGESTEIVRLDQDKMYSVNNNKKTYSEATFAEQRAQFEAGATNKMREAQASQRQATSGVDDSQCEWSEPKAEVQRSGEKATIAGFQAERVIVTATQSCKDKESDQVVTSAWCSISGSRRDSKRQRKRRHISARLRKSSGSTPPTSRDFAERAQSMFGRYQGLWKEVATKMHDVKGYPVKLSFGLGVGGPQCQSTQQTQASGGPAHRRVLAAHSVERWAGCLGRRKQRPQPRPRPTGNCRVG